ncbi:MAG TPA: sugar phosphate nucleotidyltransferase [Actinomycetota bacterium]|nr:sugar phosphate nucleotidyltransferase [Actinomycetota bacterium]
MTPTDMQAVIMAGGEGSRLRPLTSNMPKPMLPITNRPLMEHIILLLRKHGFTDVVATVQFLSSVIRNYFGDGSDLGVSLSYATEEVPLGTAGSVLGARDLLSGTFLVISGDALTDLDVQEVVAFHRAKGAAATLVLKHVPDPLEFGIVMTDADGRIERFLEKPSWGQVFSDTINTGIYVIEPDVLDLIPVDEPYDFSSQLFPAMLDKGLPLFGFVADSYWEDVGNADAYLQAHLDVLGGRVEVDMPGFELRPSVWVGEDVDVHPTARIEGPALIGDNCQIGAGAILGGYSVLGQNTIVGDDAVIAGAVVMEGAHVGPFARIRGSVLGRGASLDKGATVEEGAVIGDEVQVGAGAIIKPRVKIYPSRSVDAGAIVTESVVRERRAQRSLFGSRGVTGKVNVGITPQVAVRLGMAYGTTLKRDSVVVTGRDASRSARTIKRALIAGLNSTGVTCQDLELVPMPLTRFTVRNRQASGGIGVRTSAGDPEVVEIRLLDAGGADISLGAQRKIERVFYREDYRRSSAAKLGELEFPPRALEQYSSGLIGALDIKAIRALAPKVVIEYAHGPASLIGPALLGRLGCDFLAVNAFTDEHRPILSNEDFLRLLEELTEHVRKSGSDLGVLLEPGGEIAHLVDGRGRIVPQERALLAFMQHEANRGAGKVAVPVSTTQRALEVVAGGGGEIEWSPISIAGLMARAAEDEVVFAGTEDGAFIWPDFMPAPDALMTFGKALELVAVAGQPLADLIDDLPEFHVARREVRTPWELKGTVMRELAATHGASDPNSDLVLIDGVKIVRGNEWVLVIPYPDEPACKVWAEAPDGARSEQLADEYARIVEQIIERGDNDGLLDL